MKLIDKAFIIPCSSSDSKDFFGAYVEYLKPKHHLTETEQKVLAAILRHRHELSKSISDDILLEEVCLNKVNRERIKKTLGMSAPQFNGIMGKLRERKILSQSKITELYRINPNFIPKFDGSGDFKLMLIFKYGDGQTDQGTGSEGVQPEAKPDRENS